MSDDSDGDGAKALAGLLKFAALMLRLFAHPGMKLVTKLLARR